MYWESTKQDTKLLPITSPILTDFQTFFTALTVSNSSLFTPALLRTHSFLFFAVHETRNILLSPFISKAPRRVSSFFRLLWTGYRKKLRVSYFHEIFLEEVDYTGQRRVDSVSEDSLWVSLSTYHSPRPILGLGLFLFCHQCFDTVGWAQEEHPACKPWVVRCWCGYLSV